MNKKLMLRILDTCNNGTPTTQALISYGLRLYNNMEDGKQLWLLPKGWYGSNLNGQEFTTINGNKFTYQNHKDDDHRGGYLAYGVVLIPDLPPNNGVINETTM